MATHGVQVSGNDQDVKSLNKSVVEQEHDSREIPSDLGVPEEHLSDITNVSDFGVTKTEFPVRRQRYFGRIGLYIPDNERCIKNETSLCDRQNQAGHQAEDGVGVGERHNSQTDIFGEQERCRLWTCQYTLDSTLHK